jgi:hypothetical protein
MEFKNGFTYIFWMYAIKKLQLIIKLQNQFFMLNEEENF